jgi:hypothetical protein
MKTIFFILYSIAIIINSISGLILTNYNLINWVTVDLVLITNCFFSIKSIKSEASDGMKIGINFINTFILILLFFLIARMPNKLNDNFNLILIISLLFTQLFFVLSPSIFKKISDNN